jgi:hypothetical protein
VKKVLENTFRIDKRVSIGDNFILRACSVVGGNEPAHIELAKTLLLNLSE